MTIVDKKTGELVDGNLPFFQFRKHNFKLIRKLTSENRIAAELFFFLVENMLESSNSVIVSQDALCQVLGVTKRSIYTATKHLIDGKYIQVLKSGVNNVYCVNADIVWTKRAGEIYHARFNASVYLTSTEQDEEQKMQIKKTFEKVVDVETFGKVPEVESVTEEEKKILEAQFNIK